MAARREREELERLFALEALAAQDGIPSRRLLRQRVVYRALVEYGQLSAVSGARVALHTLPASVCRLSRELELTAVFRAPLLVAVDREGRTYMADAAAWELTRKPRGLVSLLRRLARARSMLAWVVIESGRDQGTDAAP